MTSTTSTSSSVSTSSIDVASIVSGLMDIAKQPLTSLQNNIISDRVVISDLGTLKSKISTFQTALTAMESPGSYNTVSASSNNSSAVSVSAANGTVLGRYNISVAQTAESSNYSIAGFSSATATVALGVTSPTASPFTISLGGTVYDSSVSISLSSGATLSPLTSGTSTLTDVNNWINSLASGSGVAVSSNIVQTGSNAYALVVSGTQLGVNNALSFSGINGASVTASSGSSTTTATSTNSGSNTVSINSLARDALVSVNGLQAQRTSNTIGDIVYGLTINLLTPVQPSGAAQTALVVVAPGTDNSKSIINAFVDSYNAVIAQYKLMTANATNSNSSTNGSFASNTGALGFISDIKTKIAGGALNSAGNTLSLVNMGIDLKTDGTLTFNSTNFTSSQSNGLLSTLSKGISVGGVVGNSSNLYTYLASVINPSGTIDQTINLQKTHIDYTNSKITTLSSQLALLQTNYTNQYAKLNSLLYQLSQTSSQLTSSLTAVTNINAG